ncbi:MAG: substrate-binding domain-containing protein [Candidatus Korarchaeota archaeon]|nr:substrate-binding domain-containing protein [Candidatus Korarchaeota archaeon]
MRTKLITATAVVLVLVITSLLMLESGPVRVRITTTTSLYATGLLDYLGDQFRKDHPNVELDFIAVGSGEALRRAKQGDACMVLVHAPSLEKRYMEEGAMAEGHIFAYNYFIIAGPPSDPAKVREAKSPIDAFKRIYEAGERGETSFASRGDNSGTHVKELSVWRAAGLDPKGRPWYMETGSGMGATLLVANEKGAYVLSDIGTFLKYSKDGKVPDLFILFEGGDELLNIYSVYLVPSCAGEEAKYARAFTDFVVRDAQDLIARYGISKYGQPLFYPAKDKLDWLRERWQALAEG